MRRNVKEAVYMPFVSPYATAPKKANGTNIPMNEPRTLVIGFARLAYQ